MGRAEVEKYEGIYGDGAYSKYGHTNHGAESTPIWDTWRVSSLLDVGCGHNEFVTSIREARPWIKALGVDFACPSADVRANAADLPFYHQQFDVLTAFDVLEHLRPEEVGSALREFSRVSKTFVFSIAYRPSAILWKGQNLHPTVRPETWWKDQIKAAGGEVQKHGRYLYGHWAGAPDIMTKPNPILPGPSCVLVGNGPSLAGSGLGPVIDSFENVVRFNACKIKGYEKDVGKKTTLWATPSRIEVPQDRKRFDRVIFLHGLNGSPAYVPRELWRLPLSWYHAKRRELQEASGLEGEARDRILPTSGYLLATWLLESGVEGVHLAGFDHFKKDRSGAHHYWDPSTRSRPKEHDGDGEARLLAPYVKQGRLVYLPETAVAAIR